MQHFSVFISRQPTQSSPFLFIVRPQNHEAVASAGPAGPGPGPGNWRLWHLHHKQTSTWAFYHFSLLLLFFSLQHKVNLLFHFFSGQWHNRSMWNRENGAEHHNVSHLSFRIHPPGHGPEPAVWKHWVFRNTRLHGWPSSVEIWDPH